MIPQLLLAFVASVSAIDVYAFNGNNCYGDPNGQFTNIVPYQCYNTAGSFVSSVHYKGIPENWVAHFQTYADENCNEMIQPDPHLDFGYVKSVNNICVTGSVLQKGNDQGQPVQIKSVRYETFDIPTRKRSVHGPRDV